MFNRDWEGADREFKRALELDHNYAPAHHWYSMYLALAGRKEQALDEAEKAYELDPLSPVVGANLAKKLQEAGQYDKAIEQARKTLDLEPDSAVTHAVLGFVYQDKRMYAEAITEYKSALQLGTPPGETRGLLEETTISGLPTTQPKGTRMGFLLPFSRTMQLQRVIFPTRHCPLRRNETAANRSERLNRG